MGQSVIRASDWEGNLSPTNGWAWDTNWDGLIHVHHCLLWCSAPLHCELRLYATRSCEGRIRWIESLAQYPYMTIERIRRASEGDRYGHEAWLVWGQFTVPTSQIATEELVCQLVSKTSVEKLLRAYRGSNDD